MDGETDVIEDENQARQEQDDFSPLKSGAHAPLSAPPASVEHVCSARSTAEEEDQQQQEVGHGFCFYLAICFPIVFGMALFAVLMWSSMGVGAEVYDALVGAQVLRYVFAALAAMVLLFLYLIDFFFPPHLFGQSFVLFDGDRVVGRAVIIAVILFVLLAALFSIETSPGAPGTISVMLSPILIFGLRSRIAPKSSRLEDDAEGAENRMLRRQMRELQYADACERDAVRYFSAAMVSFVLTGFIAFFTWLVYSFEERPWVVFGNASTELLYLRWVVPGVVGVSNLILGCIMGLRNSMAVSHKKFEACSVATGVGDIGIQKIYLASMAEEVGQDGECQVTQQGSMADVDMQGHLMAMKKMHLESLSNTVKRVGCIFFMMAGIIWLGGSLLASESQLASAALMLVVMFFAVYVILLMVAFRRLLTSMHATVIQLPLFRLAIRMMDNDWARAALLCGSMPILPGILLLSLVNQFVRKCRHLPTGNEEKTTGSVFDMFKMIASEEKELRRTQSNGMCGSKSCDQSIQVKPSAQPVVPGTTEDVLEPSKDMRSTERRLLTGRIMRCVATVQNWDILTILEKMYLLCLLYVIYAVTPLALNIFLAWLISIIRHFQFGIICVSVVFVGLFCFLLPPVPGVPVYLFVGLLVASTYTNDPDDMGAFMTGAMIAVVLGFIMKLLACTLQQKLIGEMLGNSLTVRQQVGVHKEMIRGIEMVLRTPGLSIGKCCILCGGPDWPTSVLAGLLRLPLSQMMIGTLPVVVFVGPCSLTGSLYMKSGDGGLLSRLGSVMLLLTVGVNLLMWVGAAWAIQSTIDANVEAIRMPLEQNIDLDWLDYRDEQMRKSCVLTWSMVPTAVRVLFVAGVVGSDLACQGLFWVKSRCLGSFSPSEDLSKIEWFDCDTCMLKLPGVAAFALAAVSFTGLLIFKCWKNKSQKVTQQARRRELDAEESQWKSTRRDDIRRSSEESDVKEPSSGISVKEAVQGKIVVEGSASWRPMDTE
eukprot:TRINITY_DN9656_c0_g2_i1.p1 TRINITY_DN9656_c0_g2~~TRINITY_DN9656_c0_g2_i1.p1  ORF type:complete len:991 (+),score=142.38 TRINITY_DN9656_c0_g2_i1:144-3116(+)